MKFFDSDLSRASLRRAKLQGANLTVANLSMAKYDINTEWPDRIDPDVAGVILVEL